METGLKGRAEATVTHEMTAASIGSGTLEVLSTPHMIALMECASMDAVSSALEPGQGTVGINVSVSHLAACCIGAKVCAVSELVEIAKGRFLTFKVSAYADGELIGEGTHQRCIIDSEKFFSKVQAKTSK